LAVDGVARIVVKACWALKVPIYKPKEFGNSHAQIPIFACPVAV